MNVSLVVSIHDICKNSKPNQLHQRLLHQISYAWSGGGSALREKLLYSFKNFDFIEVTAFKAED